MKVILAEKPSVAREIAQFLHAGARHDGYFQGNGYQVTWAYGHLVTLKDPDEYDPAWKKWSLDTLPILPERFELKTVDDKLSRKQFSIVKQLFRAADEIICATDAGREGELIFRYIQTLTGCAKKPFSRLWLSSLTAKAIREAFAKLRPGRDYDPLYAAARCRSEADWIVGMNGTRNYTVRFGGSGLLWSVGRVQTPVLAMIVRRDDQIRTFRPEPFWELLTRYRQTQFRFTGERFGDETEAQKMLQQVLGQPFTITKIETRRERSQPPQLYDLTELQREMNRRFGLSAAATLQAAQALYEAKLITYPRTDSRYLSKDVQREVPQILENLRPLRPDDIGRLDLDALRFTSRIVNDSKVGDHHAILPTGKLPGNLAGPQARVFEAIVTRLIAAFYPPCEKEVTTVDGQSAAVPFRARGYRVLDPGWTVLYPRKPKASENQDSPDEDEAQELPPFTVGESGPHEPSVRRGETSPPKPYTENTLLGAMETAGRTGRGRVAARGPEGKRTGHPRHARRHHRNAAETQLHPPGEEEPSRHRPGTLSDRRGSGPGPEESRADRAMGGQAETDRSGPVGPAPVHDRDRRLHAPHSRRQRTGRAGRPAVGRLPTLRPTGDPRQTGLRVQRLAGRLSVRAAALVAGSAAQSGRDPPPAATPLAARCPPVERRPRRDPDADRHGPRDRNPASAPGQPPIAPDQDLAPGQIVRPQKDADRLGKGCPTRGRGPTKPDAVGGDSPKLGVCPCCGAEVLEQKKSYSCSRWRDGCPLVIWKTIAGKRITVRLAQSLLKEGQTTVLKGFRSKAGKPFEARLKLIDGQVKLEFPD
jgi:DNA topoisomerase III